MKKWKAVLLIIFVVLIVGIASVVIWQRDNIAVLYTVATKDSEVIASELEDLRSGHQKEIEDTFLVTVNPPSIQQSNDVFSGSITSDQVKNELGIDELIKKGQEAGIIPTEDQANQTEDPAEDKKSGNDGIAEKDEKPKFTADELLNMCLAELYGCKIDIMDTLRIMKDDALKEWRSLPAEERTQLKKMEIGYDGLDKCYQLEVVTDQKVEEILNRYRPYLEDLNEDTSILDMLWRQYVDEKSAEKAYYLDKYMP